MEHLLSKLTNYSYELVGIFASGFIGAVLILAPLHLAFGFELGWPWVAQPFADYTGAVLLATVFFVSYLVGHSLKWLAKKDTTRDRDPTWRSLCCPDPRNAIPAEHFHAEIEPLLRSACRRLVPEFKDANPWRAFRRPAKAWLALQARHSLVPTYQNKYTLHRSLACAAALTYYECWVLALRFAWNFDWSTVIVFVCLAGLASLLSYVFSKSFRYFWTLFGTTLITETYMHLRLETLGQSDAG